MMSSSPSSWPNEIAVMISVPRSIVRINTVESGSGSLKIMRLKNGQISGMLEVNV